MAPEKAVSVPGSADKPPRRLGIDRLRLAVCLIVIAYHAIRVFDTNDLYHVKSATRLAELDPLSRFLRAWMMEYLFLVGGMMAATALATRRARDYVRQRVWRLFVPFLAGVIVLGPLIKYAEVLNHRRLTSRGVMAVEVPPDFLEVVTKFFTRISWVTWGHLWFLAYLFLLTVVLVPLFRRIARSEFDAPRYAFMLIAALLLAAIGIEAGLRPLFPYHHNLITDWANIAMYALLMLAGAALVRWPPLEDSVRRLAPAFAVLTAARRVAVRPGARHRRAGGALRPRLHHRWHAGAADLLGAAAGAAAGGQDAAAAIGAGRLCAALRAAARHRAARRRSADPRVAAHRRHHPGDGRRDVRAAALAGVAVCARRGAFSASARRRRAPHPVVLGLEPPGTRSRGGSSMRLRVYQYGELFGIVLLLASTATQLFYLEPLKREIEWRLVAFNTQQSAQIQLRAVYDNQVALLKLMNAPAEQVAATEAKRDDTLAQYKNSDANIADFMVAKEGVENYLEVIVIALFALGSLMAGLGRALEMSAARNAWRKAEAPHQSGEIQPA